MHPCIDLVLFPHPSRSVRPILFMCCAFIFIVHINLILCSLSLIALPLSHYTEEGVGILNPKLACMAFCPLFLSSLSLPISALILFSYTFFLTCGRGGGLKPPKPPPPPGSATDHHHLPRLHPYTPERNGGPYVSPCPTPQ